MSTAIASRSETQKFGHVTYFWNGNKSGYIDEALETYIEIPSDNVEFNQTPAMKLPEITELAETYGALVMVDDCHATGFMGPKGAGTPSHFGVDVDILTGTLGKALGGAIGGYIAGPQPIIDLLRQRARPYLFSNSLPPAIVAVPDTVPAVWNAPSFRFTFANAPVPVSASVPPSTSVPPVWVFTPPS